MPKKSEEVLQIMYSETIKPKVDTMFNDLRKKVFSLVSTSSVSNETINKVAKTVSSELATRSKSILSDMLFELSDSLLSTEFFSDIARQNKFYEANLRQEILDKYQFAPTTTVDYKEASKTIQALKVGGVTLAVGGAIEVGAVLIAGLSFSQLVPIPISVLIVASIGAALADYFAIAPEQNKKALTEALNNYLNQTKKQFLKWFDDVEHYFNMRVEEIKQTL